jgi:hypothetical protein
MLRHLTDYLATAAKVVDADMPVARNKWRAANVI